MPFNKYDNSTTVVTMLAATKYHVPGICLVGTYDVVSAAAYCNPVVAAVERSTTHSAKICTRSYLVRCIQQLAAAAAAVEVQLLAVFLPPAAYYIHQKRVE